MLQSIKSKLKQLRNHYRLGVRYETDAYVQQARALTEQENRKPGSRRQVINDLLATFDQSQTRYLEIGVRYPASNFDHIRAAHKHSVDPGVEYKPNPVEFPMTSDAFFEAIRQGRVLQPDVRFDVIFVDGLHLADQCWRDIVNALAFISEEGFVVVHDCNPPTQWHAREAFMYQMTPAADQWNGTTWKAYLQARNLPGIQSCCVDTDWGVGVLCRHRPLGQPTGEATGQVNPFHEFEVMNEHRQQMMNLMTYEKFQQAIAPAQQRLSV